jgi:hypothetical protein
MTKTIAEALIEEGLVKGRAGGELNAYRDTLRRFLSRKVDPLPEVVLRRIEACADRERLQAAIDRALEIKSLDELDL